MYSLEELKKANNEISDLCDVLSVLVEHREMHDNPVVCELMKRFKEKAWMHLVFEDNPVYYNLARHDDPSVSQVAQEFHDSAREIKRQFSGFVRNWCQTAVDEEQHNQLKNESLDMIGLIVERIDYENQHMFPLVEKFQSN